MKESISFIIGLLLVASLSGSPTGIDQNRLEDQASTVHNKQKPSPPAGTPDKFTQKEELVIGEDEKSNEPLFSQVNSIDVDDNENLYVLDTKACSILVFNQKGNLINRIGGKGQGPGEMLIPVSIGICDSTSIAIYDLGNRRLSFYSLEGRFIRQLNTARLGGQLIRIRPDSLGGFYALISTMGEKISEKIIRYDGELNPLFTITEIDFRQSDRTTATFFEPACFFDRMEGGRLVWGERHKYELTVVEAKGAVIKSILRDYKPLRVREEDKKREIFARYGSEGIPVGMKAEFPNTLPVFRLIIVDDSGRIYVMTYESAGEDMFYYDVFNSEGVYIAKIPLKHHPAAMKKGKYYTIETDGKGLQTIKRYSFEWK
jgi:hypothetical protein